MKALELILTLCFCACVIFFSYAGEEEDDDVILQPGDYHYSLTHTGTTSSLTPVIFMNDSSFKKEFKIYPEDENSYWNVIEN